MKILAAIIGVVFILEFLWEGFESVVLPRRVTRRGRLTIYVFRPLWIGWKAVARLIKKRNLQETWLSIFGPMLLLLMLAFWAMGIIVGFAFLDWGAGSVTSTQGKSGFSTDFYLSSAIFFSLGASDIVPQTALTRFLIVAESGMGFAFLALVISYLPLLNTSFARRETNISLLDVRAGSPPSSAEILHRNSRSSGPEELRQFLRDWESWSAQVLESHLSYPVLAFFRSQHDNQSWLGALTAILDTCALVMAGPECACNEQAKKTFAMARHTVIDLSLVFKTEPRDMSHERLGPEEIAKLLPIIKEAGVGNPDGRINESRLSELRKMYEPYAYSLAVRFHFILPPFIIIEPKMDNWQVSGWEHRTTRLKRGARPQRRDNEHF